MILERAVSEYEKFIEMGEQTLAESQRKIEQLKRQDAGDERRQMELSSFERAIADDQEDIGEGE